MAAHKHPNRRETERTRREIWRLCERDMEWSDIHRKLNESKRIKSLGGLSYPSVWRYCNQWRATRNDLAQAAS